MRDAYDFAILHIKRANARAALDPDTADSCKRPCQETLQILRQIFSRLASLEGYVQQSTMDDGSGRFGFMDV